MKRHDVVLLQWLTGIFSRPPQVAKAGGGIINTVSGTRKATVEELVQQVGSETRLGHPLVALSRRAMQAMPRIRALAADGVTTIEMKSGCAASLSRTHSYCFACSDRTCHSCLPTALHPAVACL